MKYICFIILFFTGFASEAQIITIPDVNFKDALVNGLVVDTDFGGIGDSDVDTNNDGEIQFTETEIVTSLYIQSYGIISLEGIQRFTNLNILDCM